MTATRPPHWRRTSYHIRYTAPCGTCGHLARCDEWQVEAHLPDGHDVTSLELVVRCLVCELRR